MRGRSGMRDRGFGVTQVDEPRGQLDAVHEYPARVPPTLDLEGEDAADATRKVRLRVGVVRMLRQTGIVDRHHARLRLKPGR